MKELQTQFKLLENTENQTLQALEADKQHKIKRLKIDLERYLGGYLSDLIIPISENEIKKMLRK